MPLKFNTYFICGNCDNISTISQPPSPVLWRTKLLVEDRAIRKNQSQCIRLIKHFWVGKKERESWRVQRSAVQFSALLCSLLCSVPKMKRKKGATNGEMKGRQEGTRQRIFFNWQQTQHELRKKKGLKKGAGRKSEAERSSAPWIAPHGSTLHLLYCSPGSRETRREKKGSRIREKVFKRKTGRCRTMASIEEWR